VYILGFVLFYPFDAGMGTFVSIRWYYYDYCFSHKSVNMQLSNCSQFIEFWFRYLRSTLQISATHSEIKTAIAEARDG